MLDPEFPARLAAYAKRVAQRYPLIDAYTPVNEPNTTARFSGMYGIWYPHHLSRASYLRALLNQLKGTVLEHAGDPEYTAGRAVDPDRRCADPSRGTEELRPVWELLNVRRWLTFDLLCGRVDRCHPMFAYMRSQGIPEREILWFADHPCPPDVIGINYYVTSDRFIDHRVELYPADRMSAEGPFRRRGSGARKRGEICRVRLVAPGGLESISDPCGDH